jgi:hypothetical protein
MLNHFDRRFLANHLSTFLVKWIPHENCQVSLPNFLTISLIRILGTTHQVSKNLLLFGKFSHKSSFQLYRILMNFASNGLCWPSQSTIILKKKNGLLEAI